MDRETLENRQPVWGSRWVCDARVSLRPLGSRSAASSVCGTDKRPSFRIRGALRLCRSLYHSAETIGQYGRGLHFETWARMQRLGRGATPASPQPSLPFPTCRRTAQADSAFYLATRGRSNLLSFASHLSPLESTQRSRGIQDLELVLKHSKEVYGFWGISGARP